MELGEKLQLLRKQKGLTQEELAQALFVSRTAVSKWESGRGYPNIESLRATAKFFDVTVDELLSGDELLTIAEEDTKQKKKHLCDLVFGLLDCSVAMFFLLPFFGIRNGETVREVSLLAVEGISPYLKTIYFIAVSAIVVFGIVMLTLQNCRAEFWVKIKNHISLVLNAAGAVLFIISQQPYAAVFLFAFLIIKLFVIMKRQ